MNPGPAFGRPWAFGLESGPLIVPYITLLADGRIGGSVQRSETSWTWHQGRLQFFDDAGVPTAAFGDVPGGTDGPMTYGSACLHGHSTVRGPVVLRPLTAVTAWPPRGVRARRNLVLLRAGASSLHPFWIRDIAAEDRNWDLCLSWYGDPAMRPEGCEYFFPDKGTKFEGLAKPPATETLPWDYGHVWMPDDDLMTSWADINRMFALCAEYDLMLAQPSLDADCFINHAITRRDPAQVMRFCTFIEIMAPVFSHAALRLCAASFAASRSGYGLDHLWPRLIGMPPTKIAIIDAISVVHTRPIGATYDQAGAMAEGRALEAAYGTTRRYEVLGSILARPGPAMARAGAPKVLAEAAR